MIKRWGVISMDVWHLVRTTHPELLWALSGYLFAMRREFFPKVPILPILDDVSVGLWSKALNARFKYVDQAKITVKVPSSYWDWVRQKVRIRVGWEMLKSIKRTDMVELESAIEAAKAILRNEIGLEARILFAHDRFLRSISMVRAKFFDARSYGTWAPVMSTKKWTAFEINI
jgi:hypothetical protein